MLLWFVFCVSGIVAKVLNMLSFPGLGACFFFSGLVFVCFFVCFCLFFVLFVFFFAFLS